MEVVVEPAEGGLDGEVDLGKGEVGGEDEGAADGGVGKGDADFEVGDVAGGCFLGGGGGLGKLVDYEDVFNAGVDFFDGGGVKKGEGVFFAAEAGDEGGAAGGFAAAEDAFNIFGELFFIIDDVDSAGVGAGEEGGGDIGFEEGDDDVGAEAGGEVKEGDVFFEFELGEGGFTGEEADAFSHADDEVFLKLVVFFLGNSEGGLGEEVEGGEGEY